MEAIRLGRAVLGVRLLVRTLVPDAGFGRNTVLQMLGLQFTAPLHGMGGIIYTFRQTYE